MAYSAFSATSDGSAFYTANFTYTHSNHTLTVNAIGKGDSSGYAIYTGADRNFHIISITALGNFTF